jgi:hypothetical protein
MLIALSVAFALVAAGFTWLFGPYGLIGSGIGCAALVFFFVDKVEEKRGDPVPDALPQAPGRGVPLHL